MEKHFLEQYKTQDKPEAKKAAERKEQRTGERGIFQDRSERIRAYIERLKNVFLNPDSRVRERNIELLRPTIYENTLIKPDDFPETHFEFHKQQLVDRGIPREQVEQSFDGEKKEQEIRRVIESQRMSLDNWIDYLTGGDCKYPADIKYFAIQGVLRLGTFDTQKYSFAKRLPSTTAPFAEIDREALSAVLGAIEAKNYGKQTAKYSKDLLDLIERGNSFGDMYALTMRELDQKAEKSDLLPIVDGEWRVFDKGSNPQELVNALVGKRSNLCIADIGSATAYLNQGAVEVYFSYNRARQLTIPRIAIAYDKEKGGVYEVRGTYNKNEDADPYIEESGILMKRLKDLPNGESFAKKDADMREVTKLYRKCFSIDRKTKEKTYLNPPLTKEELQFLYEINSTIDGFGYGKDPRIVELRQERNVEEDKLVIFECTRDQIARNKNEINENTKVYVGEWNPEVCKTIRQFPSIKHLYKSFPEKKVFALNLEIDPRINSPEKAEEAFKAKNIDLSGWCKDIIYKTTFSQKRETYKLARFSVAELGFPRGATTEEIYQRANELGLELCPVEVGLHLRLQYLGKEKMAIAMKQITDRYGDPYVFFLHAYGTQLAFIGTRCMPGGRWLSDSEFVFCLRKGGKERTSKLI